MNEPGLDDVLAAAARADARVAQWPEWKREIDTMETEQLALATAARLAHALDPDGWARCHATSVAGRRCSLHRSHGPDHHTRGDSMSGPGHRWKGWDDALTTLAEAKAEWAAAGGDPERGPALSGSAEEGRVRWCSNEFGVSVHVGFLTATRRAGSMEWDFGGHGTSACLVELGRLAEAADGGAR